MIIKIKRGLLEDKKDEDRFSGKSKLRKNHFV